MKALILASALLLAGLSIGCDDREPTTPEPANPSRPVPPKPQASPGGLSLAAGDLARPGLC